MVSFRRSQFANYFLRIGPMVVTFDIRNDPKWKRRRLRFTRADDRPFIERLREELDKVREDNERADEFERRGRYGG